MKVKCIKQDFDKTRLTIGKVYDVISTDEHYYRFYDNIGKFDGWDHSLFVVVKDDNLSHDCPCGIARVQCDYHRI